MRNIKIDYGNTNNIINNLKNIVINLENEKRQIKNALNELYDLENYYNSKGEILRELEYRERQASKDIEDTEILIENINSFSTKVKEVDENLANKFKQDVAKYSKENNIEITNELDAFLNKVQAGLDVIGLFPVVGDIADGINGVISLARGDILGATISFVAMVPLIGDAAKGLKYMDKAADLLKLGDKVVDIGKATAKVEERKLAKLAKKETLEIISKGEKEFKNVLEATLDLGQNDYVAWIKNKGEVLLNTVTDELQHNIQVCINNGCLVGDTLVKTIDGLKVIKEIKVGELVLSKNEETGLTEYKKVTEIHKNSTYESCTIKTENSIIEGTTGHLFMVKDKWWTPAIEIKENDYVELANGSYEKIIEVEYICREYPINTYNLTVEDNHNYYIEKDEVLTHNMGRKINCKLAEGLSNSGLSRMEYLRNKYGKLTSEQINNRINLRGAVNNEIERLYKSGITKKELGPAVAGVLDHKTGKYYYGINNVKGKVPKELHPLIKERIDNMPPKIYSSYEKWTLGAGSHAEVYALNEALLANPTAKLEDFMVYVVRSGKKLKPRGLPMPRCPHCEYITNGASYFPEVLKYGD